MASLLPTVGGEIFLIKILKHFLHWDFPFIFIAFWRIRTRHKTSVLIRWFLCSLELQSVSSTSMVLQDRFKSTIHWWAKRHLNDNLTNALTSLRHLQQCILPLNIVNEKTYIFIWFWYLILLTMLIGLVIYRLLIIFVPSVRARVLNARNRMVPREIAVAVSNKVDIGDWWIIYMLGRNLDPIIYKDVLAELSKSISVPAKKSKNWRYSWI